jgi:hypothetical protein
MYRPAKSVSPCNSDFVEQSLIWEANLCILKIGAIRMVPDVPVSHPFVERLIGNIRR